MGKEWSVFYRGNRWVRKRPCRWQPKGNFTFWVLTKDVRFAICGKPFKGMCKVAAWSRPDGSRGRPELLLRRWGYPDMKRVKKEDRVSVKHLAPMETELFKEQLPLVEHTAMLQYEDGTSRQPGWFTIRTSGAAWVITVKDPDSASSFSVVAKTLDEAVGTASLLLACEEAPWEPDAWLAAQRRKGGAK